MKLSLHPHSGLRVFGISAIVTVVALIAVAAYLGPAALGIAAVLIAVELAFSFDNAIINAKVLGRLNPFWQRMFLTVGVVIAIFGMRVVFPMLIVMATAHLPFGQVLDLALHHPSIYAEKLTNAHPSIAAFGGCFLLMLALHFFMDDERELHWIQRIERPLKQMARWWAPTAVTLAVLLVFAYASSDQYVVETIRAGSIGIVLYLAINLFTEWIGGLAERKTSGSRSGSKGTGSSGLIGLMTFLYLQVLDGSFSFDSVIGAFAITNSVVLIAVGLGVGAIWVRSLTVFMVRRGILESYRFLEHGAHYAVLALALAMFAGLLVDIPQYIIGVVGLAVIAASIVASRRYQAAA